jgi:hypothetical protein
MKSFILPAVALSLAVPFAAVHAEEGEAAPAAAAPAAPKLGSVIWTTDGKRLGRVDEFRKAKGGEVTSVGIIYDSRFVFVPISTLTANDKGFVSSLSLKEVLGK